MAEGYSTWKLSAAHLQNFQIENLHTHWFVIYIVVAPFVFVIIGFRLVKNIRVTLNKCISVGDLSDEKTNPSKQTEEVKR